MHRPQILATFARERCSAILRTKLADAVAPAMEAAITGGFRIVEFTLTTPNALAHIAAFARNSDLLVGAGTVLTIKDAEAAIKAGARFLVSPVTDTDLLGWCKANHVICIPGTLTPTEMLTAWRAGAEIQKLFPAPADGPGYVRACLGPMPFLKIFPTSGVHEQNARAYLDAGAFGVGFVASLFEPEDMEHGRFDAIRARAARLVASVRR